MFANLPVYFLAWSGFLLLWIDVFILRTDILSKIGTLLILSCSILVFLKMIMYRKKGILIYTIFFSLLVVSFEFPSRDVFLIFLLLLVFNNSYYARKGFSKALDIFLLVGIIAVLLSLIGVGNEAKVSESRLLGRFALGFATPYHLSEFIIVYFFVFVTRFKGILNRIITYNVATIFIILSASRVSLLAIFSLIFIRLTNSKYIRAILLTLLIVANAYLVYFLAVNSGYTEESSFRDLVIKSVLATYYDRFQDDSFHYLLFGVLNNSDVAYYTAVSRWESTVPLDGIFIKSLASGILGTITTLVLIIYISFESIKSSYIFSIFIVFLILGFGADMFNLWHMITPLLLYSLASNTDRL